MYYTIKKWKSKNKAKWKYYATSTSKKCGWLSDFQSFGIVWEDSLSLGYL